MRDFYLENLDKDLFFEETNFRASEHPRLYLQWLQARLLHKMQLELKEIRQQLQRPGSEGMSQGKG